MLQAATEEKEIKETMDPANPRGVQSHLFFGHVPTQQAFAKRDFGTTHNLVYEKLQNTEKIIDPHRFENDKEVIRHKMHCNGKASDLPSMFDKSGAQLASLKPKAYGIYTASFDLNNNKTGLRE